MKRDTTRLFKWFGKKKEQKNEVNEILNDSLLTKSEKMRRLFAMGLDVTTIANYMGVRYNFVYNMVRDYIRTNTYAKQEEHDTKKQQIIQLHTEGHSRNEISKLLSTDYNYVSRVISAH
jgi:transposase-like protein